MSRPKRATAFLLLVYGLIVVIALHSKAEESTTLSNKGEDKSSSFFDSWLKQPYLTGNWGGIRDKLSVKGIDFSGFYAATVLGNPAGGEKKGLKYAALLSLYVDLDFEKLSNLRGLRFRISGSWASGKSLSEDDIGNFFQVSSVFSGQSVRVFQLFLEQSLLDDRINIALGRLGTGDDFMTSRLFNNFVSLAFDQNPISIFFNIQSFTVDTFATWGAR